MSETLREQEKTEITPHQESGDVETDPERVLGSLAAASVEASEADTAPKEDYDVLNSGFLRNESAEDLRQRYVYLTKRLIKRMCGYDEPEERADTVIFLDKSARPVSWLVKEFWEDFAERDPETGETLPLPEFKFLNIDKDHWIEPEEMQQETGSPIVYWNGKHKVGPQGLRGLRSIFLEREPEPGEDEFETPSMLDGKKVLIVDEVKSTGTTKKLASTLIKEAYPDAEIESAYWMASEMEQIDGGWRQLDNPIWYDTESSAGRGVGNRDFEVSGKSRSRRQRAGKAFLSTRLSGGDTLSQKLRDDIKLLHHEYLSGELSIPEGYDLSKVYQRAKR